MGCLIIGFVCILLSGFPVKCKQMFCYCRKIKNYTYGFQRTFVAMKKKYIFNITFQAKEFSLSLGKMKFDLGVFVYCLLHSNIHLKQISI